MPAAVATPAALPSLASVVDWSWGPSAGHRGNVPSMPKHERTAWNVLGNQAALNRGETKLYRALTRKLQYRANREINRSYC